MDLGDLIAYNHIIMPLQANTKKQCLQKLAIKAEELSYISQRVIFETLLQRERLGSTGLGKGIAVPHVKFRDFDHIKCIFARLNKPIDFEALDNEPVDLIFLLLAPGHASGDHLKALARISRLLREPKVCKYLRSSSSIQDVVGVLTQPSAAFCAA
ncbi:MAG: PTS sugar transporter subunit IIA [Hyphomicrobiaceae bacterium]|nr:PTS sugar transporter subunit IIA [Hyphomicrobiaceae bacterium]